MLLLLVSRCNLFKNANKATSKLNTQLHRFFVVSKIKKEEGWFILVQYIGLSHSLSLLGMK